MCFLIFFFFCIFRLGVEGQLVRDILYGSRENVNFVHEVYRQAFLLSFSHSPAIKKVISVYKDWIQMNVSELPPFLLEPPPSSIEREREELRQVMAGKYPDSFDATSILYKDQLSVRAGLQNVLQIFVTNAANVFLLEVSSEYPILMGKFYLTRSFLPNVVNMVNFLADFQLTIIFFQHLDLFYMCKCVKFLI